MLEAKLASPPVALYLVILALYIMVRHRFLSQTMITYFVDVCGSNLMLFTKVI